VHITGSFLLTLTDSGTEVSLTAALQPQGVFRALAPVMALVIKRQNAAAASRLKSALEQT
jgi:hypothetical protein